MCVKETKDGKICGTYSLLCRILMFEIIIRRDENKVRLSANEYHKSLSSTQMNI